MSHTTKDAARSLAINYAAYTAAIQKSDNLGIIVWGRGLLQSQRDSGIELIDEITLQDTIDFADCMDKRERLETGRKRRAELSL